jgi:hypothetical protein
MAVTTLCDYLVKKDETMTITTDFEVFARPPRAAVVAPVLEVEESDDLFISHARACVSCGASFQTCGKGKRCSGCLLQGSAEPIQPAHITCRVCDRPATVPLDHPALLCPLCLIDLDATRARVAGWLAAALERLDANEQAWQATKSASAALDRWPAIQGALIAVAEKRVTSQALDATWQKRKAEGGALAQLLEAHEAYARECDRLNTELERLHRAQAEINAAYLATEI